MKFNEETLLNFVRKELNSGKTKIVIPSMLILNVSDEVLIEIKRWCNMNGVTVNVTV